LAGESVGYSEYGRYRGKIVYEDRGARIYGFGGRKTPSDFILHEVLHLVLRRLAGVRGGRQRRQAEEEVVQDICEVFRADCGKKK